MNSYLDYKEMANNIFESPEMIVHDSVKKEFYFKGGKFIANQRKWRFCQLISWFGE